MNNLVIFAAFGATLAFFAFLGWLFRSTTVRVRPYRSHLVLRFGKCVEELREPGLHFRPALLIPGYRCLEVSRQLDSETLRDLHVTDRDGTTLRIDLWIEYQVEDAKRSAFAVESWREALRNSLVHVLTDSIASRRLDTVIRDREAVSAEMVEAVRADAETWGIRVEQLWIQDVRILPEIAKQFFDRVAARLEMDKARIEEEGRIRIQTLQAKTERKVAVLQAQARAMHPIAVGRAYAELGKNGKILSAYEELNRLSLLQPNRTVTFVGFNPGEVRPLDAVMIPELDHLKQEPRISAIETESTS